MAKPQPTPPAKVVNVMDHAVRFSVSVMAGAPSRDYELQPGQVISLEGGYALRRQPSPDRDLQPSIVEQLTNGQVLPIGDPRAKEAMRRHGTTPTTATSAPSSSKPKATTPTDDDADDLTPPGEVAPQQPAAAGKGRR